MTFKKNDPKSRAAAKKGRATQRAEGRYQRGKACQVCGVILLGHQENRTERCMAHMGR